MLQYFSMLVGFWVALLYNVALAETCVGLSQCSTYVLQASSVQDSAPVETPPLPSYRSHAGGLGLIASTVAAQRIGSCCEVPHAPHQ